MKTGSCTISSATRIMYGLGAENQAKYLQDYLKKHYGLPLTTALHNGKTCGSTTNSIQLVFRADTKTADSYKLEVFENTIDIQGNTAAGIFYGVQTLLQLLPADHQLPVSKSLPVPLLLINDYRGLLTGGCTLTLAGIFFLPAI